MPTIADLRRFSMLYVDAEEEASVRTARDLELAGYHHEPDAEDVERIAARGAFTVDP